MHWLWLGAIALWTLACAALLAAFSTWDAVWGALIVAAVAATAGWLGMAVALTVRRRWSRGFLLAWAGWPLALGVVALLYVTDLPLTLRVAASRSALSRVLEEARTSGPTRRRAGLVVVFETRARDGCVFLTAGSSFDGITGLIHVPEGVAPASHPDWAATDSRHLYGPWWYFKTRT